MSTDKLPAKEMGWDWLVEALEDQERGEQSVEDHEEDWVDEKEEDEEWKAVAGLERRSCIERNYPPLTPEHLS